MLTAHPIRFFLSALVLILVSPRFIVSLNIPMDIVFFLSIKTEKVHPKCRITI